MFTKKKQEPDTGILKNGTPTSSSEMGNSFCAALLELTAVGVETLVARLSSAVIPFTCHVQTCTPVQCEPRLLNRSLWLTDELQKPSSKAALTTPASSFIILWSGTFTYDLDLWTWPRYGQNEPWCQICRSKSFCSKVVVRIHKNTHSRSNCSTQILKWLVKICIS